MKRIVILGAGTAGTMMANRLVRVLPPSWHVTVIDRDDDHVYQPGLLFIPFGMYRDDELVKSRRRTLDPRVDLRLVEIDRVAPDEQKVRLVGGEALVYDFLIVATGSRILPEATPGLTGVGWGEHAFDFYTPEGARGLRRALERWPGGRLVVNVAEMPIKCPVAPLEFLFLAEAYFTERGLRDKVEILYATPLEGAFTKPVASAHLGGMLARRGIGVTGDFAVAEVDGARRVLKAYDGREEPYDLLVTIPLHGGAAVITDSKLGDGSALGAARSMPSALPARFGPRISASLAFLSSACCCLAAMALTPWPTRRSTSIITAMPRWTSSSLVARIMPNRPSGLVASAPWIASPASAATRRTSGWVRVRTVSRMVTTASPSWRTSAAEKCSTTRWPMPPSSRTKAMVPSRSS